MSATILVADDDSIPRQNIAMVLQEEGFTVHQAGDGLEAIDAIREFDFDLILTDLKMPGADGLAVLEETRKTSPQTVVILMTAFASVETAVNAFRMGAHDYILKPVVLNDVLQKIRRSLELKTLAWEVDLFRREANQASKDLGLVGQGRSVKNILALISKVASTTSTVLITGESGVGKEVVARALHLQSASKDKVFLPINCSAIPDTLLESQLFGHTKGSFTGAVAAQTGMFQKAQGGTIFLDEIGELPLTLQPKLLRVIEAKEVMPLGSENAVQLDVRIIAATNRELKKEVEERRFREDLFYRLNVINIEVPPLRERRDDIPALVEHLIRRHNRAMKKNYKGVDNAAMKNLMSLPWKGNVRELDNVLERAMILGDGEWVTSDNLPQVTADEPVEDTGGANNLRVALDSYEKSHIENVLREANGDRTRAAQLLGLSRSSLYRKLEKLGIREEHSAN